MWHSQSEGRLAGAEFRPNAIARLAGPPGFRDTLPRDLLGLRRVPGSEQRGGELSEQERPQERDWVQPEAVASTPSRDRP